MRIMILLAMCLTCVGCATAPAHVDEFCLVASPILLDQADVVSASTAREIISYNEFGAKRCGWKPPTKKPAAKPRPASV